MIEGFAREMPEDEMADALMEAHRYIGEICDLQQELIDKVQPKKMDYQPPASDGLFAVLEERYFNQLLQAKQTEGKQARAEAVSAVKSEALAALIPDADADGAYTLGSFKKSWHDLEEKVIRDQILAGNRPDGRDGKTLRSIECEVDLLPRVHGSALFQRGRNPGLDYHYLGHRSR